MKRKIKNVLSLFAAMILALSVLLTTGASAFAQSPRDVWYVGWEDDTYQKYIGWNETSDISIDAGTYYKDSRYSIKITNSEDYDFGCVEKTVELEPYTTYKFSAMVKYSGYELSPDSMYYNSGAVLDIYTVVDGELTWVTQSEVYHDNDWTKLECLIRTGGEKKEYCFRLLNGDYWSKCKGTAWFSDIKLEKEKTTNQWNVLAVIFKNVDIYEDFNGKDTSFQPAGTGKSRYQTTLSDEDYEAVKAVTNNLKTSMSEMSEGNINIRDIDFVTVDEPVTEVEVYNSTSSYNGEVIEFNSFCLNFDAECVSKVLDKYIAQKTYQQIIVFAPLAEIGSWWGLGGNKYKGINICEISCNGGCAFSYHEGEFDESTMVHEIMHGIETETNEIDGSMIDMVHNSEKYGYEEETKEWFSAILLRKTPNGEGANPLTFYRPSGKYTLVSNDMTTGGVIEQSDDLPISLSSTMLTKIADQVYSGKLVKPAVTLKDGRYTLKNGVDYTVDYTNNMEIGTATATITGKGLYTGTVTAEFNIVENLKVDGLRGVNGASFKTNEAFTAKGLELTFDASHAGKFANLYKNDNGEKKFVACAKLDKNGKATLSKVSEKADYIVMLCEFSDLPGDMNNDGILNANDSLAVLKHFLEMEKGANPEFCDVNNDKVINPKDALIIIQMSLEII